MTGGARLSLHAGLATAGAATALASVYQGSGWLIPTMGAITVVALVAHAARRSRLPSLLEPLAVAVAVLCWLTLLDARRGALLGLVPGRRSLDTLSAVATSGFDDIHRLSTPVPDHRGLVLLTTVAVAAVALVVDLLAVTLRRAALAGLPLLALVTTCAAVGRHGVGALPFVLATTGFLALLYADSRERVHRWGSRIGDGSAATAPGGWSAAPSMPALLSRRIGAAAIGLGLIVPIVIPGLHDGIDRHHSGGGGASAGNVVTINPIVSVTQDLTAGSEIPLLSYRSSTADPSYLRLTSLDVFNGTTFSAPTLVAPASARVTDRLPVGPPAGTPVTTQVDVGRALSVHWLPLPVSAFGVRVAADWRFDPVTATVFSASTSTQALRYTTTSVALQPTPAQLRGTTTINPVATSDLSLPHIDPAVVALTRRVTAGAASKYEQAVDIQRFLTGPRFRYDLHVRPVGGPDALADFLLRSRRGFCQQFASAMAVMARLSGIPARVAVGFTRGHRLQDGSWLVTTHDAHAWPELYFDGFGWLPFEPTPRSDGQAVAPAYSLAQNGTRAGHRRGAAGADSAPAGSDTRSTRPRLPAGVDRGNQATTIGRLPAKHGTSPRALAGLALGALVLLCLALPATLRQVTRRRRWHQLHDQPSATSPAWAELRDVALDLGAPWAAGRSPREAGRGLATVVAPDASGLAALDRLVRAEQEARYAAHPAPPGGDLRGDVRVVAALLRARRSRWQRLLAVILPRSAVVATRQVVSRLAEQPARVRQRVSGRVLSS